MSVIRYLDSNVNSLLESAIATLCIGAIFFCMRSCEYTKTPNQENRKTKLLCLRNINFYKKGSVAPIDTKSPTIEAEADMVSITFEDQKNREKLETVTNHKSGDKTLCPVLAWQKIVKRIQSYPESNQDTPVNVFYRNGKRQYITNTNVLIELRKAVKNIGFDHLGFTEKEIGTHSIRSGGAMILKLAKVDSNDIMLFGRWKSLSFMRYIRKQIAEFSNNFASKVLENEHFFHIPSHLRRDHSS